MAAKKETKKVKAPAQPQPMRVNAKFHIGDIVFLAKEAETDLNGFKIFPQYKKSTYTVEAYDQNTGVYSLRRSNLLLKLKEAFILAPSEKSNDSLGRVQF